ncbi:unnamed protein product [Hymenolepis diminuta]|uniref:Helicase C-terminal domain-containing protein n=1 Tax=Hymenolepis diminuta TaxID=6216 RepID=A0A3P6ZZK8_HYMDI|nr:unnamed protein product [Hymenolepis diminuta]
MILFFIDITDIRYIVNYDYPHQTEDYVHRIGRTGRSNKTGTAYTFFNSDNPKTAYQLIKVLREANQNIPSKLEDLSRGVGGVVKAREICKWRMEKSAYRRSDKYDREKCRRRSRSRSSSRRSRRDQHHPKSPRRNSSSSSSLDRHRKRSCRSLSESSHVDRRKRRRVDSKENYRKGYRSRSSSKHGHHKHNRSGSRSKRSCSRDSYKRKKERSWKEVRSVSRSVSGRSRSRSHSSACGRSHISRSLNDYREIQKNGGHSDGFRSCTVSGKTPPVNSHL